MQKELTRKADLEKARGTLKAAQLVGDPKIEGLVSLSLYDSKPFYMMTMACEKVEWVLKSRKLWDRELMKMVDKPFYRLNIVDEYNTHMNNVDVADQLRGSYRFDHWMRKQKWWWSMFFWCFQMLMTNAYVTYKKYQMIHGLKPMTHYEFWKQIALAWIHPLKYWPDNNRKKSRKRVSTEVEESDGVNTRSAASTSSSVNDNSSLKRSQAFSDRSLDPEKGALKNRLVVGGHWPEAIPPGMDVNCQLHRWATGKKHRAKVVKCKQCKVNLCVDCFYVFHTKHQLTGEFKREMQRKNITNKKPVPKTAKNMTAV